MKALRDLSYRVKIPLAITAVIVMTEVVVTFALLSRAGADARTDLEASARNLIAILGRSLRDPLVRDDLWQAFEVIRTPLVARTAENPLQSIVVLDATGAVFVSSDPRTVPVTTESERLMPPLSILAGAVEAATPFRFLFDRTHGHVAAVGSVLADDEAVIGHVMLTFDADRYDDRVTSTLTDLGLISMLGLLVLIPLGWYWGKAMAEPLVRLAATLARVGTDPPADLVAALPRTGRDEIGALADSAAVMLRGLQRQHEMEREMLTAERLAAVGRVSAAIAHEINNPLGGMLNAVDTLRTHGMPDALTHRTLGLLQRGLQQIRSTVAALLVEARLDSPMLGPDDWDDLKTLIDPHAGELAIKVRWQIAAEMCAEDACIAVPAHLVRQLMLNLLLNACKAAGAGGTVLFDARLDSGALRVEVGNSGVQIPRQAMDRLFEPFVVATERDRGRGFGIGLWVCYQITHELGGAIDVSSEPGWTRFVICLPVPPSP
jgi:signal transduction histidine kinase